MNIFIVNLKNSVERRQKMEEQLHALGLSAEFIEAVDGRFMSDDERKRVTADVNYAFLPGEIGCALSHQKIYKRIVDEGIAQALILEDDVLIENILPELLNGIKLSNSTPEIILLSRVNKFRMKAVRSITTIYKIHKTEQATTAHAYIINNKAASSFLNNLYPVWMTSDKWSLFEDLSMAKIYSVIPYPVRLSEEAETSTINQSKGDVEINLKKKHIWELLMQQRPLRAKIRHRYRRAITPLLHKVVNQGKG
ncbi:glycosyltransferase family 25 protein [Enterobacter ludwigii]|uniref:glycosyltransferase family 25 protein n=1 Tax=Enterobacter ludwigii TaxID=299767 RepID=UPI0028DFBB60|nr:glycosyltransferase family 25 protein [Enterobacter ludwigii]